MASFADENVANSFYFTPKLMFSNNAILFLFSTSIMTRKSTSRNYLNASKSMYTLIDTSSLSQSVTVILFSGIAREVKVSGTIEASVFGFGVEGCCSTVPWCTNIQLYRRRLILEHFDKLAG